MARVAQARVLGAAAAALALAAGCDTNEIVAVGTPAGAFRPGAGCVVEALAAGPAASCTPSAQFGFYRLVEEAEFEFLLAILFEV
jgi:hypothetical protein